ncbi:hypothetical protein E5R92_03865 [Candidatus Pelagibacter giovannonii]|mgnify:FL=1|uniref:Uncharacterized protein n=1 Tax=Candidatus Pelagibacter giovannonii TaxID=2563896 RepID=A0A6H1Q482_9PROT|nr:hypothetical protein E5R92_03865 [Candidatus Pelagibacter giovannonii]
MNSYVDNYFFLFKIIIMEVLLIIKILFIIGLAITIYAILRNLDILKIIFIYLKDSLFDK